VRSRECRGMHATGEESKEDRQTTGLATFSKRWRRSTEASEHVASPRAGWYSAGVLVVATEGVISLNALSKLDSS
jgi:imidazoleglycerol phosphate synthase glutamine amidotransferase subunit HisH